MSITHPVRRACRIWSLYGLLPSLLLSYALAGTLSLPKQAMFWLFGGLNMAFWLYNRLRLRHIAYQVNSEAVCRHSGMFLRLSRTVPRGSIRQVLVAQGPLERHYGLALVIIATVGGYMVLEGIPLELARRWCSLLTGATEHHPRHPRKRKNGTS